ncbi:MAG: acyl-CoA/acyl-ACP dehydrogenase [Planctomycetaceae bacterium]|nr:acyl-CoA/acyl-ACP dehydrogenase [Planctomycetaceae bacterium]
MLSEYITNNQVYLRAFQQIAEKAQITDLENLWPAQQLQCLTDAGISALGIPEIYGGRLVTEQEMAHVYLDCTSACLTTSFVLSQRNAAVQRIVACQSEQLKQRLLPGLAAGEHFATVGISHLSSSGQHLGKPMVVARETELGYVLSGMVPWVTGAIHADLLVTGATLEDGRQILLAIETNTEGVELGKPVSMLSLTCSATGNMHLNEVFVPHENLVAGPVENVMKSGGGGTGSLTTSLIATGVARRAIRLLSEEADLREDLQTQSNQLIAEMTEVLNDLEIAQSDSACHQPELTPQNLRTRSNSLVLRASQAYLTAAKGRGFVLGHAAERTVRESMFFLVWSCPQPVAQAAMREFACSPNWQS